ncbi:MAG: Na(+)/H(+) antiporter subunit C [Acidimicrobiales bacterium]
MSITMAILIGILTSVGVYLMLHRTLTRIVLGVGMLGNAVNLMIIAAGGPPGEAPIVGRDGPFADPVPQALVLTAIVIGFGIISILLAVAYRSWTIDGNDEVEDDISDRQMASVRDPSEFVEEPDDRYSQEELL